MYEAFIGFLKADAGESLRAVGSYDSDDYEIHYLRDSIDPKRAKARAGALHDITWDLAPPDEPVLDDLATSLHPSICTLKP